MPDSLFRMNLNNILFRMIIDNKSLTFFLVLFNLFLLFACTFLYFGFTKVFT